MKNKRILVTGGAGFIGVHLCKKLLDEGNQVICLDNFFTGSENNINIFRQNDNFKVVMHDIITPINMEIDQIYNLACPASPVHYQVDRVRTLKTSVYGSLNMLELAKNNNARILQASTSEVYGDPKINPQVESYFGNVNHIGPRACYDEGKRASETLFFDYNRQFDIDIRVVRIFNTYGPYMAIDDGRVISNFIIQALKNKDITVYGDGNQTRSFCYVDDMVNGLYKMMNQNLNIGPLNLGNPEEITIKDVASEIINLVGSNSKIVYKNLPEDDPVQRKPDINLARKIVDWNPKVSRTQGLKKTIDYFKKLF